jgi:short-subunit dehydrogenase
MDPRGSNVLLTGAGGGLGPYVARALAADGANLALSDVSEERVDGLAAELRRTRGARVEVVPADLISADGPDTLASTAAAALGPIDVLVNNAGVEFIGPFEAHSSEEVEAIVRLNLYAPIELTRLLLPGMLERGRGHVVNMCSLAGRTAAPFGSTYCATKGGLIAFTQALRAEFPKGPVGFSAISPGFVRSVGMYGRIEGRTKTPVTGLIDPERIGKAVIRAIRDDRAEQIINQRPMKPTVLLGILAPGLAAKVNARVMRSSVEAIARSNGRY